MSDKQQTPGDADAQITDASDGEAAAAPAPVSKYNTPSRASVVVMVAIALLGLTLILRAWQLWPFNSSHVHTDDAYVRGQVTVLAPQVSGYVTDVLVKDFDHVKQGQPLLRQVRLGPVQGDQVEVLAGLSAGDKVVTAPQAAVRLAPAGR